MPQKINPKQYQRDMIQCLHSGAQSITSTAATVAYSGGTIAIGTRVTQSGSTVVIGSGVVLQAIYILVLKSMPLSYLNKLMVALHNFDQRMIVGFFQFLPEMLLV